VLTEMTVSTIPEATARNGGRSACAGVRAEHAVSGKHSLSSALWNGQVGTALYRPAPIAA